MKTSARRLIALATCTLALGGASACGDDEEQTTVGGDRERPCLNGEMAVNPSGESQYEAPEAVTAASCAYSAVIRTNHGEIVLDLDHAGAPATVNSFVFLANNGFYDGLSFHRVIDGFMIQGGDPSGDGSGGPGYTLPDELPTGGYPQGVLAMANAGPGTGGSQFFIVSGDASFLPNAYSRFGTVTAGLDVAQEIAALGSPADNDRPREPVTIESIRVTERDAAG